MIDNLRELNDKVNDFVNYVVKTACENTTSGNYYVSVADASKAAGMEYDDFLEYKEFIINELYSREELLDFEYLEDSLEFDVNCALDYCPGYQWCEGDEDIFDCSFDEWLNTSTKLISQPLSLSRMAEVAVAAVEELKNISFDQGFYNDTFVSNLGFGPEEAEAFGLKDDLDFGPVFYVGDGINFDKDFTSFDDALITFQWLTSYKLPDVTMGVLFPDKTSFPLMFSIDGLTEVLKVPFDEMKNQELASELESKLSSIQKEFCPENDLDVGRWKVHIVPPGGVLRGGLNKSNKSLVEFWDMNSNKSDFPDGQFVCRYFISTLLERSQEYKDFGLCLNSDVPGCKVTGDDMSKIYHWLANREYLPGEHYVEYHGDIELPVSHGGKATLFAQFSEFSWARDLKNVECIGSFTGGTAYSFSFTTQVDHKIVKKNFQNVFGSLSRNYDLIRDEKIVGRKEPLDKIIRSCANMNKKADVVDINKYREERT